MKLNLKEIENIRKIKEIKTPNYNINQIKENTIKNPKWLHFGAGNIFRGYIGKIQQVLIEKGKENSGIVVAENFDPEIIEKVYTPFDNLTIASILNKNGDFKNEIIGSIVEAIEVNKDRLEKLKKIVKNPNLQIISFTITEKGYNLKNPSGEYIQVIKEDIENGFDFPKHIVSLLTKLLYIRFKNDKKPVTLLSMDNCSGNGDKIKNSILEIATLWKERKIVEKEFVEYLLEKVSYPITMIDKITPRPSVEVEKVLETLGFENMKPIVTEKNSYIAPFVNLEEPEYFVIEDKFLNGRPKFEEAGVYLTDRQTVEKTEKMKVTTCLNPLHTTLAIFGCLLNKKSIYDSVIDKDLNRLIKEVGYGEALKVVESPKILDPKAFIDEVIDERFSNPYIPDQPERIATDTSQKIAIRFGETIKSYNNSDKLDVKSLKYIPLVLAGWFRYLLGIDDDGKERSISKDPMLDILKENMKGIEFGNPRSYNGQLRKILRNDRIFGIDLESVGLSEKIEGYFIEMIEGKGAVRRTLEKYL